MKNIKVILFLLLTTFIWHSCIKDSSIGAVNAISKISLTNNGIADYYELDEFDTLKISGLQFAQTNTNKPVTYAWDVNYKVVSTQPNLKYLCVGIGTFACRLKVTNEDGSFFKVFSLTIRSKDYTKGLYILGTYNKKTIVTYFADSISTKPIVLDALGTSNPGVEIGAEPKSLFFSNFFTDSTRNFAYVSTGNPAKLYRLYSNTMIADAVRSTDAPITGITHDGISSTANSNDSRVASIVFVMNQRVANLWFTDTLFTNARQQAIQAKYGSVQLFDKMYYWRSTDLRYYNGELYFDQLTSKLFYYSINGVPTGYNRIEELFAGKFAGYTPIDFCYADKKRKFVGVFKNNSTGALKLYYFFPGYYSTSLSNVIQPALLYEGNVPASSNLTANAVITSSSVKDLMYYSNGANVYAYSILSSGNFPTTPLFTADSPNETVAAMLINKDESTMYVGTNDGSSALQGSIYCYNINNNTLLWKKKNITGVIKQLDYRYK